MPDDVSELMTKKNIKLYDHLIETSDTFIYKQKWSSIDDTYDNHQDTSQDRKDEKDLKGMCEEASCVENYESFTKRNTVYTYADVLSELLFSENETCFCHDIIQAKHFSDMLYVAKNAVKNPSLRPLVFFIFDDVRSNNKNKICRERARKLFMHGSWYGYFENRTAVEKHIYNTRPPNDIREESKNIDTKYFPDVSQIRNTSQGELFLVDVLNATKTPQLCGNAKDDTKKILNILEQIFVKYFSFHNNRHCNVISTQNNGKIKKIIISDEFHWVADLMGTKDVMALFPGIFLRDHCISVINKLCLSLSKRVPRRGRSSSPKIKFK